MSLVGTPIAEIVPSVPTVRLISATEKAKLIETEGVKEENTESSSKNKPASIDKKERRREQNRRAAVKSRKRKKVYMQELEAKVKELKETNENLLSKMQALLEENERLKKRQRADNVVKVKKESPGTAVLSMEPVVKSESAALVSQQMELMAVMTCQNLMFLVMTLLAFGNQLISSRVTVFSKNHSGPPTLLRLVTSSLSKAPNFAKFYRLLELTSKCGGRFSSSNLAIRKCDCDGGGGSAFSSQLCVR
eukprot:CAMPEP_0167752894 /NCGR_PEP_ID=MMETSP0110_2-20121227/7399_1 /TAXON_ID=629695 /ORGANISM="Gymnochlora sp., Strain CCMP2014" /LENGTH=248 /DNA_ID=CAMNT_0007638575 /DNA_START=128 /DNA_END=874 /DNA_ORIENTATION=-